MSYKNLVILVSSSPFASLNNHEALRTSLGLMDHKVSVIWCGEGVYNAMSLVDNSSVKPFIRLFKDVGIDLFVDKNDLGQRNIKDEELISEVKAIERTEMLDLICKADFVITF